MTPVMLLSDGYIANGAEPWLIPTLDEPAEIKSTRAERDGNGDGPFLPYTRDPRPSPARGPFPARRASSTASAASRRQDVTGNVSYDPRTTSTW